MPPKVISDNRRGSISCKLRSDDARIEHPPVTSVTADRKSFSVAGSEDASISSDNIANIIRQNYIGIFYAVIAETYTLNLPYFPTKYNFVVKK